MVPVNSAIRGISRVLALHRRSTFMVPRIIEGEGHGAALQALRERGARQERLDARQAALPVQEPRPERHRHPAARQAFSDEGDSRAALCQRAVDDERQRRSIAKLLGVSTPTVQAWMERFAEVYAHKPEPEGRAVVVELDGMWPDLKKPRTAKLAGC